MKRFYSHSCKGDGSHVLSGGEHNHLANVLHCKVGESVIIICGDDFDYEYRIRLITKTAASLEFVKKTRNKCNPESDLTVCLAAIKPDNIALTVQKLTELGVSALIIFTSARTQNTLINLDRLNTIARQSCKQCGRSKPLAVRGALPFDKMLEHTAARKTFFADETAQTFPHLNSFKHNAQEPAALIIGPEGGWTAEERARLCEYAEPITLGKRILRAETAAIAAASLLLAAMGEI